MPFGLPAIAETNWGQKILDSINAVKATADAAQQASTLDASVAAKVNADSSATRGRLNAAIAEETRAYDTHQGLSILAAGAVDVSSTSTTWVEVGAAAQVSFLVPPSGKVAIDASFGYSISAPSTSLELALRDEFGVQVPNSAQRISRPSGTANHQARGTYRHVYQGTPGDYVSLRLAMRRGDGTGTVFVSYSDSSSVWGQLTLTATAVPTEPTWQKYDGFVLEGNGTTEQGAVLEPIVINDPTGVHQLRMFYSGGWDSSAVYAAVSDDDGFTWTREGGALFGGGAAGVTGSIAHTGLAVDGSTLHIFFSEDIATTTLRRITSTDGGLTWGNPITIFTATGWESGRWGNSACVIVGGTWHLLYEAMASADSIWKMGYATSPDGITFTRQNGGNPLTSLSHGGMYGGPDLHRRGDGTWELFYHASTVSNSPTNIYRAVSNDMITWQWYPSGSTPILTNTLAYEYDQVADPCVITIKGQRVMFYEGVSNPTATAKINRAVFR